MRRINIKTIKILLGIAAIVLAAGFLAGVFFNKTGGEPAGLSPATYAPEQGKKQNNGSVDLVRPPFLNE